MIELVVIFAVLGVVLLAFAPAAFSLFDPQRERRRLARRHGEFK